MNVVLVSLFHYDDFALRLLFSYLKVQNIPVYYISFKRMKQKATQTLKNDYVEMHDFHDPITEEDIATLLEELDKLNPCLIGIGLKSIHFDIAKQLTRRIKNRFKAPVVWGGVHPTLDPENCIKHTDIVCVGEGFDALVELSKSVIEGRPYDTVKNLWINKNGAIIRNSSRPLIGNLDILPFASYTSENKIYIDDGRVQNEKNIDYFGFGFTDTPRKAFHQTMTAFGCPMKCSFCINCLDYDKFRRRSVGNVIGELVKAKEENENLRMVFFWDNIFAVNKKWCLEFSQMYREKINLPFFAYSHPLCSDMEAFTALRKAGWAITVMGIQSGSYELRKTLYARSETNEKILEAAQKLNELKSVRSCRKYFRIYYDYVKNNPLEGKKDLAESLDLFLKFPKGFIFQAFNLSFFPNYPITKYFLEHNLISEKNIEGNAVGTSASNWITTFDSKKEYRGFLRRHEYYYLLFSLAQFKSFPNFLIKLIEKKKLFCNRLNILYKLCRIIRMLELAMRISNYCWLWELMRAIPLRLKIKYKTLVRYS
jgi:radical SAM superfamily enzyme YgiQ (UPF0313 family)